MPDESRRSALAADLEIDVAITHPSGTRFRLSAFTNRAGPAAALRAIPSTVPSLDPLGAPWVLRKVGARHSIAATPTAAPAACVRPWDAVQAGNHDQALDLHRRLLLRWNAPIADNLPACTKYAQTLQAVPAGRPRAPMPPASPARQRAIQPALRELT